MIILKSFCNSSRTRSYRIQQVITSTVGCGAIYVKEEGSWPSLTPQKVAVRPGARALARRLFMEQNSILLLVPPRTNGSWRR